MRTIIILATLALAAASNGAVISTPTYSGPYDSNMAVANGISSVIDGDSGISNVSLWQIGTNASLAMSSGVSWSGSASPSLARFEIDSGGTLFGGTPVSGNTLAGAISGSGSLSNSGFLTLSGINTYTGGTAITGGELTGTSLSIQGDIAMAGGVVSFIQDFDGEYSGIIRGTASGTSRFLTKSGAGMLRLTADSAVQVAPLQSAYVDINGGTLWLGNGGTSGWIDGVTNFDLYTGGNSTLVVDLAKDVFFGGLISSKNGLDTLMRKLGSGTLSLVSAPGSGQTWVEAGRMAVDTSSLPGTIGTGANNVRVDAGAEFVWKNSAARSADSVSNLSGAGLAIKRGDGVLNLNSPGGFTGLFRVEGGSVDFYSNSGSTAWNMNLDLGSGTSALWRVGANINFAGVISGPGLFTKSGSNTLTLTGANTATGLVTVTSGTLEIGNGGATGLIASNIALSGGQLRWNKSSDDTYSQQITGTGLFAKAGNGTLALTGTNTFTGGTTIAGGRLFISGDSGSIAGNISIGSGSIFGVNKDNDATLGGFIYGSGGLTKMGNGTLTLLGTNSYSGGTTISGGVLQVGDGGSTGSMVSGVNIGSGSRFIYNKSTADTYGGVLSGTGFFTKNGSGTLTLTGNNTASGLTTVAGGTLQIGNNGASGSMGSSIDLVGGHLRWSKTSSDSYSGAISGSGTVSKTGTGTLTLTGNNTYTGATSLTGGNLQIGNGGSDGSIVSSVDMLPGRRLTWNKSSADTYGGVISGNGAFFTKTGSGTLTLTGNNTATGLATVSRGILEIGNGAAAGGIGSSVALLGGHLRWNKSSDDVYSNVISGTGTFTKAGTGMLTLTGNNTYAGSTTIAGGTLRYLTSAVSPVISGAGASTRLQIDNAAAGTLTAALTGGMILGKGGAGTLTIATTLANTSGLFVSGGMVRLTDATPGFDLFASPYSITISDTGYLYVDRAGSDRFDITAFTGTSGTFEKTGAGTLTLGGDAPANGFLGSTIVSQGILRVEGDYLSPITVRGGAKLVVNALVDGSQEPGGVIADSFARVSGSGTIERTLTINNDAVLAPGNSPGTLTMDTLILSASSRMEYELGTPGIVGSNVNDLSIVSGDVTLDGFVDVVPYPGFGLGSYRLINYGGVLTNNGLDLGTIPFGYTLANFVVWTAPGQVNLDVVSLGNPDPVTPEYWFNGTTLAPVGHVVGGSGVWDNTARTNWSNAGGTSSNAWVGPTMAIFAGAPGNVNVTEDVLISGAKFLTDGYSFAGIGRIGFRNADTEFNTATDVTAIIANEMAGIGGMRKTGAGALVLTGLNTFAGGLSLESGSVQVGNRGTSGVLPGNASLAAGTTLAFSRSDNSTYSGNISGAGRVENRWSGTTTLTGSNTFTGGTSILSGAVQVGDGGTLGEIAGDVSAASNAKLIWNKSSDSVFGGVISGSGGLEKRGTGLLALTSDNTFTGITTVTGGTLQLGNNTPGGTVGGNVVNNSTLAFHRSVDSVFGGAISGTGSLVKLGTSTLTLTGANSYSGQTSVSGGTLQIGNGGSAGAIGTGDVLNNGALVWNKTNGGDTVAGNISGTGSLEARTTNGSLVLLGNNTYTGGTTISAGTLQIGESAYGGLTGSLSGNIVNNGQLYYEKATADTYAGIISGNGSVRHAGGGSLTLTGENTFTGGLTIDGSNTVQVGDGGTAGSILGSVANSGDFKWNKSSTDTFAGNVSGSGRFTKLGTGTLIATGDLSNSTGIVISDGTLQVGNGGTAGSIAARIDNAASLVWDKSADGQFNAFISGNGTLTKRGAGTLSLLTYRNDYTGLTTIEEGKLLVRLNARVLGNVDTFAGTQFEWDITSGATETLAGNITGAGELVKSGLGTLALTGNMTAAAGTTISNGTLQIGNGGAVGSLAGDVRTGSSDAYLSWRKSAADTFGGNLSGTGNLWVRGTGQLTLTGNATHTGRTIVASGSTLQIGNGGATGSISGSNIDNSGVLIWNRAAADVYGGIISGSGAFTKRGSGALTLTGNSTGSGATRVEAGSLLVNGSTRSATTVESGATLGGSGRIDNLVTIRDGGALAPGTSPGTISVAALTLDPLSILNFELSTPGVVGSGVNDLIDVSGNLVLDGLLNVADAGGFTFGTYRLINYGGVLTDQGLTINSVPLGYGAFVVQTSIAGEVNLIVNSAGPYAFWNGTNLLPSGTVNGGNGVWNNAAANTNWTNAAGTGTGPWAVGDAIFTATPGTVDLGDNVAFNNMQFAVGGYSVNGNGNTMTASLPVSEIRTDAGTTTINAAIAGSTIQKTGAGTLALTGANVYGDTLVSGGLLKIGTGGTSGSLGTGSVALAGGNLEFDRSDDIAVSNAITGIGGHVIKSGSNTLTYTGAGSAAATVNAGSLIVTGTLGDIDVAATLGGTGTVGNVNASGALAPGLPGLAGTLNTLSLTLSPTSILAFDFGAPNIVGSGVNDLLNIVGNLVLDGTLNINNLGGFGYGSYRIADYSGSLTNSGLALGITPVGFDPAEMTIQTSINGQVNLVFTAAPTGPYPFWNGSTTSPAGTINGGSGVWDNLAGNTNWSTAAGDASGPWTPQFAIFTGSAGTATLGDNVSASGLQFAVDGYKIESPLGYTLTLTDPVSAVRVDTGTATLNAEIAGSAQLDKQGVGTLVLGGENTYSGGTVVNRGVLQVGNGLTGSVVGNIDLAGGNLVFHRDNDSTSGNNITGPGSLTKSGSGTLNVAGSVSNTGGVAINAGRLNLVDGGSISNNIVVAGGAVFGVNQTGDITLPGSISGAGSLVKDGAGTTTLAGTNTYSGGTTVNAGRLVGDSNSLQGAILNNAAVEFNQAAAGTYGGSMTGNGGLTKSGSGTLSITGSLAHTGGTAINAGRMDLLDGSSLAGDVSIANAAILGVNRSSDMSLPGSISGAGSLVKDGPGILDLTGTNTYSGGTTVNGGTLRGNSLAIQGDISNNAVVEFSQAAAGTYAGDMTGTGSLVKSGAGVLGIAGSLGHAGGTAINAGRLNILDGGSLVGNVVVAGGAVFGVDQTAGTLTLPGAISGAGSLVKDGASTLILTGANSYTGGTTVNAGVLQGDTASLQGAINNFAVVRFGQETDGNFTGVISGTGSVQKTGAGTLGLSGSHSYTGTTDLIGGAIRMDNATLATSQFNVGPGTVLSGSGSIAGNLVNSGTVFPARIGLSIGGDFTQLPTGILVIEVASASDFSHLDITGTATLAGTLRVVRLDSYTPKVGDALRIIDAAGGVSGKFSVFEQSGNVFTVDYGTDNVTLRVGGGPGPDPQPDPIQTMPEANAILAKKAVGASIAWTASGLKEIAFSDTQNLASALGTRGGAIRSGRASGFQSYGFANAPIQPENLKLPDGWSLWAAGSGTFASVIQIKDVPKFNYVTGSVLVGADRKFENGFSAGLYGGYSGTISKQQNAGQVEVNTARAGLYGTFSKGAAWAAGSIGGTGSSYTLRRKDPLNSLTATGNPNSWGIESTLSGGYDFRRGALTVTPFASAQLSVLAVDSYTETGAGGMNARVGSQTAASLRGTLGVAASYDIALSRDITLTPNASVYYQREFLDNGYSLPVQLSSGTGTRLDAEIGAGGRNIVGGSVGATLRYKENLSAFVSAGAQISGTQTTGTVSAGLGISF